MKKIPYKLQIKHINRLVIPLPVHDHVAQVERVFDEGCHGGSS